MTNARVWSAAKRVGKRMRRAGTVLLVASVLAGCLLPIPGSVSGGISEETMASIRPGVTTRADVLLMLADPHSRSREDGCFTYSWVEHHGGAVLVFAVPGGGAPIAGATTVSCHVVAIRFSSDGRVSETRRFDGRVHGEGFTLFSLDAPAKDPCVVDAELTQRVQAWIDEVPEADRRP